MLSGFERNIYQFLAYTWIILRSLYGSQRRHCYKYSHFTLFCSDIQWMALPLNKTDRNVSSYNKHAYEADITQPQNQVFYPQEAYQRNTSGVKALRSLTWKNFSDTREPVTNLQSKPLPEQKSELVSRLWRVCGREQRDNKWLWRHSVCYSLGGGGKALIFGLMSGGNGGLTSWLGDRYGGILLPGVIGGVGFPGTGEWG